MLLLPERLFPHDWGWEIKCWSVCNVALIICSILIKGYFYNLDHWHYFSRYVDQIPNAELYAQRDYMYDSRLTYNRPEAGKSGFRTKPFVQCGMETMGILGTAINEMLLQSHEGKIRVFPAIPSEIRICFYSTR